MNGAASGALRARRFLVVPVDMIACPVGDVTEVIGLGRTAEYWKFDPHRPHPLGVVDPSIQCPGDRGRVSGGGCWEILNFSSARACRFRAACRCRRTATSGPPHSGTQPAAAVAWCRPAFTGGAPDAMPEIIRHHHSRRRQSRCATGTFGDTASIVSGCLMSSTVYGRRCRDCPRSLIVPFPRNPTSGTARTGEIGLVERPARGRPPARGRSAW